MLENKNTRNKKIYKGMKKMTVKTHCRLTHIGNTVLLINLLVILFLVHTKSLTAYLCQWQIA